MKPNLTAAEAVAKSAITQVLVWLVSRVSRLPKTRRENLLTLMEETRMELVRGDITEAVGIVAVARSIEKCTGGKGVDSPLNLAESAVIFLKAEKNVR